MSFFENAQPHSSVGSIEDLRTGGRLFDPRLDQYSFRELMIVIVTGFIPLSLLSMVKWETIDETTDSGEKNESCRNDYHQSSERILA